MTEHMAMQHSAGYHTLSLCLTCQVRLILVLAITHWNGPNGHEPQVSGGAGYLWMACM